MIILFCTDQNTGGELKLTCDINSINFVSMEKDGFRAAITNGIRAAYDRSVELGG